MDNQQAIEVLTSHRGAILNRNTKLEQALELAIQALQKKAAANPKSLGERQGQKWESSEDDMLKNLFNDNNSTKEIAEALQRSSGSVRSRMHKLGLIDLTY